MGRKRNQGKARKAAKAKAREEAEDRANDNLTANNGPAQSLAAQVRQLQMNEEKCRHGFDNSAISAVTNNFLFAFTRAFDLSFLKVHRSSAHRTLEGCIIHAQKATMDEFADVWNDFNMSDTAMSFFLAFGTQQYLDGDDAQIFATYARYLEQYIAVALKQSQAIIDWPKIQDIYQADDHTLVSFFRHRIPCSCLDEKYQEMKHITKMGYCYNCCVTPQCSIPGRRVERRKTKYCSRCRSATYCSRGCQEANWSRHKPICDKYAEVIAEFEADPHRPER